MKAVQAVALGLCLLGMTALLPRDALADSLNNCQTSSKTDTDTSVTFFVNNVCDVKICVDARVTQRTNVNGDVISGVLLMEPQERNGVVGSFAVADPEQAWSVDIETRATDECY